MVKQAGFSLVELMITVVIVAILTMIAIPSYERYKVKVNRVAAQSDLVEMGTKLQQYLVTRRSFTKDNGFIGLNDVNLTNQLPRNEPSLYTVSLNVTANSWELIAAPNIDTRQEGDGFLVLNSKGYRCWNKQLTTACQPSATTNWDGR